MFKSLNIMRYFFLILLTFTINAQDNFKVFVPEFIPIGGSFEVSLITSNNFSEADMLNIYLSPDVSLRINKVELWTNGGKSQIPFISEFIPGSSELSQKVTINLTDSTIFSSGSFFQLVFSLKPDQTSSSSMNVYGEFLSNGEVVGHLNNSDDDLISDQPNYYNLSFSYYEKYLTAEFAASFSENSYLNIPLVYHFDETLIAEFWMKFKDYSSTFLEILDLETNRVEYNISVNENKMLVIDTKDNDLIQSKPCFISNKIWYHFSIAFDNSTSVLSFLCNGNKFAKIKVKNYFDLDNLVLRFQGSDPQGALSIDQFRLVITNSFLSGINKNINFPDYSDDSSKVILQMNFAEAELGNLLEKKMISYEGIKLIKSDAPIFPRAPEIDVNISNNFYEIEWEGGDFRNADYYILERAIGNANFLVISREVADNTEKKKYLVISERPDQPDICYFRIRQINKDGSSIFSDVVKIGQGIIEDIILGQNYPNPFNPTTLIEFELLLDSDVEIKVYNLAGVEVALLHKGFLSSGIHQFEFDARGFPSGIYIYQVTTAYSTKTHKMILTK